MTVDQPMTPAVRTPPHNYEAEQAVLGALFLDSRVFDQVAEFLRPEHFADPVHGRVFEAVATLIERGQAANPVSLKAFFERDGGLAEIGGVRYLGELMRCAPSTLLAGEYARQVHDFHLRRELIALGLSMVEDGYLPEVSVTTPMLVEQIESRLSEMAADSSAGGRPVRASEFVEEMLAEHDEARRNGRRMTGQPTYFSDLDERLGGMQPGDMLVLAGRPSMGKSAKAFSIAARVAEAPERGEVGGPVAVFLGEGGRKQMVQRLLSDRADVPYGLIRTGKTNQQQFERLAAHSREWLARLPLFIDDNADLSVSAIRARARRIKRRHGLALVVIDHLQLLPGDDLQNRTQEVSRITRAVKAMAKSLACPVLLLSQLNRGVEAREDKRPMLADLRESGSIEQDADAVIFAFREEYYLERAEPMRRPDESEEKFNNRSSQWASRLAEVKGYAEFIVAKLRDGECGTVRERWDGAYQRFSDL